MNSMNRTFREELSRMQIALTTQCMQIAKKWEVSPQEIMRTVQNILKATILYMNLQANNNNSATALMPKDREAARIDAIRKLYICGKGWEEDPRRNGNL